MPNVRSVSSMHCSEPSSAIRQSSMASAVDELTAKRTPPASGWAPSGNGWPGRTWGRDSVDTRTCLPETVGVLLERVLLACGVPGYRSRNHQPGEELLVGRPAGGRGAGQREEEHPAGPRLR